MNFISFKTDTAWIIIISENKIRKTIFKKIHKILSYKIIFNEYIPFLIYQKAIEIAFRTRMTKLN